MMQDVVDYRCGGARSTEIATLSARESEMLALLIEGYSIRTVGRRLAISDAAANAHRRELMRKFKVSTTIDLISRAVLASALSGGGEVSREP